MKCFRRVCSLILAMTILCSVCMVIPVVSAKVGNGNPCAESSLKVDKNMKTVTVNYYVTTEKKIEDFQGYLTYDENVLQINQLNQKVTDGMMYNEKRTGKIYFAGVNIDPKFDFTAETLLFSAVFDVISDGDTSVNAVIDLADDEDDETIVDSANDINSGSVDTRVEIVDADLLAFNERSLSVYNNLIINYKADASLFSEDGYSSPYAVFTINGKSTTVKDYKLSNDGKKVVFSFDNISPDKMNDKIFIKLYADRNGRTYYTQTYKYSIADYCYNTLRNSKYLDNAELRTLLVDMLNYGSSAQLYTEHNKDALANANLTEEEKACGTSEIPEVTSVKNSKAVEIDSPIANWKTIGVGLGDTPMIKIGFNGLNSLNDVYAIAEVNGKKWKIDSNEFTKTGNNSYILYFDQLNAAQMGTTVYFTIYENDNAISNTFSYSIESYVASQRNYLQSDSLLLNLLNNLVRYGNSAKAYVIANS